MSAPSGYLASLGYRRGSVVGSVTCEACAQSFIPHPGGVVVEGSVLRGHRRRCPVAPAEVPTPGVCDS